MNKKAISILLTAAMGVSVLAAGTVTVSAAEKKDKYVIGCHSVILVNHGV